jgi:hypothetical protein
MATGRKLTLVDVIEAVDKVATNDRETLATLIHLLTSGQVRLSDKAIRAMQELLVTTQVAA